MAKSKTKMDRKLDVARGARGIDRKEALAAGGQQALIWRSGGVKGSCTTDRRKRASKRACRGRVSQ